MGIKRKGVYNYHLAWNQDHGAIVVAKAAEAALVRGENIGQFIRNHIHTEPLDFMLRTKINRSDKLVLETPVEWEGKRVTDTVSECQRVTRYYVSKDGGYLFKLMKPTKDQIAKWTGTPHWKHRTTGVIKQSLKRPSGMYELTPPPTPEPPMRRIGIESGFKVTIANRLSGLNMSNVDFDYYINRARDLVDPLLRNKPCDSR